MWTRIKAYWARNKARYEEAVRRYGWPVMLTAILLNVVWIATLVTLVKIGFEIEGVGGTAGLIGGAWLVSKPFIPVRLALAVIIAPPIVIAWRKFRGLPIELPPAEDPAEVARREAEAKAAAKGSKKRRKRKKKKKPPTEADADPALETP